MKKPSDIKIKARPLTGGQIRELRADGIMLNNIDPARLDETVAIVIDMALTPDEISELDARPYSQTLAIFSDIIGATYGPEDDAKN
jgi:hypothetical protein